MLHSMTGFGRCFLENERHTQVWEVRSVNGRRLDIRWKLPAKARVFETALEKRVKARALRGSLDISLYLQTRRTSIQSMHLNEDLADAMLNALSEYADSRGDAFDPDYSRLLAVPSLWEENAGDADDEILHDLETGLDDALDDWDEARITEGAALEKDLLSRILRMEEWTRILMERAPAVKEERFALVRGRLDEMLEQHGGNLDEGRFLQEIVLLADKLDVSEELVRLSAHLERLRELPGTDRDVGRKLDFTLQECFREVATCGNKIQDAQLARLIVDMKNELEKCREQAQNIE
ncbi:MAG: YicC family protein [Desulfovibrio sp.]|jgi:uncharacterized protein (TIGR00255 family)|nr:YicC family protein [Desulfovibrio sp.]